VGSLVVALIIGYDYVIDRGLFSDTNQYFSSGNLVEAPFFDVLNGQLAFVQDNFRSSIIWWFLIAAIFAVVLNQTRYGNAVFAAGGNPQAARAQGVNVNRVKVLNFVLSGTLAAVAGIMEGARFKVVEPLRGTGYELDVIAATVIGGTLLSGGYGSIGGTILGVLLAFMLKTGLVLIGVEADWFRGVLGLIMIVAVVINTNIRRQR
jgi:simple sugar transport system permease protein